MLKYITILLGVIASAVPMTFNRYTYEYNKTYSDPEEYNFRRGVYYSNVAFIEEHNSHNYSYTLGINQFTDITNSEFRDLNFDSTFEPSTNPATEFIEITDLPDMVDWTADGIVTYVKDQERCGSCWAFATTGAVESAYALKHDVLVSLSEQELVDCVTTDRGCFGGLPDDAFFWIEKHSGLCKEDDYPYIGKKGQCHSCTAVASVKSFVDVPSNNSNALKSAVAHQPVSVGIDAGGIKFQLYRSGVFTSQCGTKLDHAVLVTGYGTSDDNLDYWIIKNSWGKYWGNGGYMKLARQENDNSPGKCGICMTPSFPIVV